MSNVEVLSDNYTFEDIQGALQDIISNQDATIEELQTRPWYKKIISNISFSRNDQKVALKGVRDTNTLIQLLILLLSHMYDEHKNDVTHLIGAVGNAFNEIALIKRTVSELEGYFYKQNKKNEIKSLNEKESLALIRSVNYIISHTSSNYEYYLEDMRNYNKVLRLFFGIENSVNEDVQPDKELPDIETAKAKIIYHCLLEVISFADASLSTETIAIYEKLHDELEIGKKTKREIREDVLREIQIVGQDFLIEKYKNESRNIQGEIEIDEDFLEFEEYTPLTEYCRDGLYNDGINPVETKDVEYNAINNYSQLSKLILYILHADENGQTEFLGKVVANDKYAQVLREIELQDISNEAIIAIFETEGYFVFTTHGVYYKKKYGDNIYQSLPYSNISDIRTTKIAENQHSLKVGDSFTICDNFVDEPKLAHLFDSISELPPSAFSDNDRNLFFIKLSDKYHLHFLAIVVYLFKKYKNSKEEIYRFFVDEGFSFHFDDVLFSASLIHSDDMCRNEIARLIDRIPYPSQKSVSAEMLLMVLKLMVEILQENSMPQDMLPFIHCFDKNCFDDDRLLSFIQLFDEIRICVNGNYTDIDSKYKNACEFLITNGLGCSCIAFLPIISSSYNKILGKNLVDLFYKNGIENIDRNYSWEHTILQLAFVKWNCSSLCNILKIINDRTGEYDTDYLWKKYQYAVKIKYCLVMHNCSNIDLIKDDYVEELHLAEYYDAPEILLFHNRANLIMSNETLERAKEHYMKYQIKESIPLFEKAAADGCGRAYYYLGVIFTNGYKKVGIDNVHAKVCFKVGAELGDSLSLLKYIEFEKNNSLNKPVLYLIIPKIIGEANAGDPVVQYELSKMYYDGIGVSKSIYQGFDWLKKSADGKYCVAMNKLGGAYWEQIFGAGKGDKYRAGPYWAQAALLGYEFSIYNCRSHDKYCNPINYGYIYEQFQELERLGFGPVLNKLAYERSFNNSGLRWNFCQKELLKKAAASGDNHAVNNNNRLKQKGKLHWLSYELTSTLLDGKMNYYFEDK